MNKEELRQYSAKLLGEKEELQQRIDKAIEYIEQQKLHRVETTAVLYTMQERKLLDILKGSDKE